MKETSKNTFQKSTITCSCGASFETYSNKPEHRVETCSLCHPLYTNKVGTHKKTGAVEKFNKKYNIED